MHGKRTIQDLKNQMQREPVYDSKRLPMPKPNYLVLWGASDRENRREAYRNAGFTLAPLTESPGYEILEIRKIDLNR